MTHRKSIGVSRNLPGRRELLRAATLAAGAVVLRAARAAELPGSRALGKDGISRNAASIHQEPVFAASPKRLYSALTDARQFDQVIRLSGVMKDSSSDVPASISGVEGGTFALFGGYITGRQIVLLPDRLIVQAWRAGSWGPDLYSIARFQIIEQGSGSMILFDHGGFPSGQAEHLAAGWQANYWTPLARLLAQ